MANIQVRKWAAERQRKIELSWATRTQAMYTAMGYWVNEGDENKALEYAKMLSLDEIEKEVLNLIENEPEAPKEVSNGSYERFMLAFGNGAQRG